MKWLVLVVLFQMVVLSQDAEAGIFGRRRFQPKPSRTLTYDSYDSYPTQTVDSLPAHGSTKVSSGWIYEFRSTGSHSGTWYPVRPVGANPVDYRDGTPVHGAVRYKNGLRYTYNSYDGTWWSDWH